MKKEQPKKLKNLSVVEVSLVGKPANGKAFLMTKGEPNMNLQEKLAGIMATPFDTEEKFNELLLKEEVNLTDEAKSALMSAMRMLAAYTEELPEGLFGMIRQSLGMEDDTKAADETEKSDEAKPTTEVRHEDQKHDEADDVLKSIEDLPDAVKSHVEDLYKAKQEALEKAEEVSKELEMAHQEKITKEFIEKASAEYQNIPSVNSQELGTLIKGLHDLDTEMANKFESILKATDAVIGKGGEFDEIGKKTVADDTGTAYEKMRKAAKALVGDGTAKTIEKAMDDVMKANPKLYQEYLQGN